MIEDIERMIEERYCDFRDDHGFDETDETKDAIRAAVRTTPIDVGLQGGEVFHLGDDWHVTVLHTPGHTWGSVCVFDPRSNALIIGDAVLGRVVPLADGNPAFPPTYRYLDTYAGTIQRLQGMGLDTLLAAHEPVFQGPAVAEFLAESRAFVDHTEQAVTARLRDADDPVTMRQLADELSPVLGSWPAEASSALSFPLAAHLERLVSHKQVEAVREEGSPVGFVWRG